MNTPALETERLLLRRFTPADVAAYYRIMSDKTVNRFLPWFPIESMEEATASLRKRYLDSYQNPSGFRYAICLKEDNIPIGYVNVSEGGSHDFGYGLRKEFWRRGIVTEACVAVIAQLEAAGLPFITATHDVDNPRSGAVMKRLGMTYRYSDREQWQPKDISVVFRMYQRNLGERESAVYRKYWDTYPDHFVEEGV